MVEEVSHGVIVPLGIGDERTEKREKRKENREQVIRDQVIRDWGLEKQLTTTYTKLTK
jgi:hypothetical protein